MYNIWTLLRSFIKDMQAWISSVPIKGLIFRSIQIQKNSRSGVFALLEESKLWISVSCIFRTLVFWISLHFFYLKISHAYSKVAVAQLVNFNLDSVRLMNSTKCVGSLEMRGNLIWDSSQSSSAPLSLIYRRKFGSVRWEKFFCNCRTNVAANSGVHTKQAHPKLDVDFVLVVNVLVIRKYIYNSLIVSLRESTCGLERLDKVEQES
jgi:hypothetical protein